MDRAEIDFTRVNEYLKKKGLESFYFEKVSLDASDCEQLRQDVSRYEQAVQKWVFDQEAKEQSGR